MYGMVNQAIGIKYHPRPPSQKMVLVFMVQVRLISMASRRKRALAVLDYHRCGVGGGGELECGREVREPIQNFK